jgi:uncharacterized linocin/CFP29 family protein
MSDIQVDLVSPEGVDGALAAYMQQNKTDVGRMRPFLATGKDKVERSYVSVYMGLDGEGKKTYKAVPLQVNNATLRRDEWKQLDDAVLNVQRERLTGIADLESRGLTYNLTNPMGTMVLQYEDMDDSMEVEMTMDGVSRSKNDRPNYETKYLPIPIIHGDYEISARELEASRRLGTPLDTTKAEQVARRISEKLERLLFTNTSFTKGGGSIYSYISHPNRNLATLSLAWDNASKTPAQILDDVIGMKNKMIEDHFFGPYVIYIPTAYETVMDKDFINTVAGTQTNGSSDTIRQRLLKIENIAAIKVSDFLPANNVVMVQMTSNVVRLVKGFAMQNVEWKSEGGMVTNYKVMTIQVPQIRATQSGQCGIVHLA